MEDQQEMPEPQEGKSLLILMVAGVLMEEELLVVKIQVKWTGVELTQADE